MKYETKGRLCNAGLVLAAAFLLALKFGLVGCFGLCMLALYVKDPWE